MPRKYTLHVPTWQPVEVTIGDNCPGCGQSLTTPGALQVWEWSCQVNTLGEDDMLEPDGETDYESTFSETIRCAKCKRDVGATRESLLAKAWAQVESQDLDRPWGEILDRIRSAGRCYSLTEQEVTELTHKANKAQELK